MTKTVFTSFYFSELEDNVSQSYIQSDSSETDDDDHEPDDDNEDIENDCVMSCELPTLPNHIRCSCHTLNLIATSDTRKIVSTYPNLKKVHTTAILRCRKLWSKQRTPQQCEIVSSHLKQLIPRPTVVRWNSLLRAIDSISNCEDRITTTLYEELNISKNFRLRKSDFDYLKKYKKIMQPLADTIDYLQGEYNCFYGTLMPSLISLRNKWQILINARQCVKTGSLLSDLKDRLESRFDDFFKIEGAGEKAAIAACLHPQFKMIWTTGLPTELKEKVRAALLNAASSVEVVAPDQPEPPRVAPSNFFVFSTEQNLPQNNQCSASSESTISQYLAEPTDKKSLRKVHSFMKCLLNIIHLYRHLHLSRGCFLKRQC